MKADKVNSKTKKFKIVKLVGMRNGTSDCTIEQYIVEVLQEREWSEKEGAGLWKISLYGNNTKFGILNTYCIKVAGMWYLNSTGEKYLRDGGFNGHKLYVRSSQSIADINFKSDLISASGTILTIDPKHIPRSEQQNIATLLTTLKAARVSVKVAQETVDKAYLNLKTAKEAENMAADIVRTALEL